MTKLWSTVPGKGSSKKTEALGRTRSKFVGKVFSIAPGTHRCHYCGEEGHGTKECRYVVQQAGSKKQMPSQALLQKTVACPHPQPVLRGLKVHASPWTMKEHVIETRHAPSHMCINCSEEHPARFCPHPLCKMARRDFHMMKSRSSPVLKQCSIYLRWLGW